MQDLSWRGCSKDSQNKDGVRRDTKPCLRSSEVLVEIHQRVTMTVGIMLWDFCLPRSGKQTCCLEGITVFLRAVIIIVVVIITLVIIGLTEHSSFGCVFLPPTRDYFMAACDHTSGRIKLDFGSCWQNSGHWSYFRLLIHIHFFKKRTLCLDFLSDIEWYLNK